MIEPPVKNSTTLDAEIVARYETVRDYARVMQCYAEQTDWDRLLDLQTTYMSTLAELAEIERDVVLCDEAAHRKITLIHEIRSAEHRIRAPLEQRLAELSGAMAESRRRGQADRAYRSAARV